MPGAVAGVAAVEEENAVSWGEQRSRLNQLRAEPPPQVFPRMMEALRRGHFYRSIQIGFASLARRRERILLNGIQPLRLATFLTYRSGKTPVSLFVFWRWPSGWSTDWPRDGKQPGWQVRRSIYDTSPCGFVWGYGPRRFFAISYGHRHICDVPLFVERGGGRPGGRVAACGGNRRGMATFARADGLALTAAVALLGIEVLSPPPLPPATSTAWCGRSGLSTPGEAQYDGAGSAGRATT